MTIAVQTVRPLKLHPLNDHTHWLWTGYVHCTLAQLHKDTSTSVLNDILISTERRLTLMNDILKR